MLKSFSPIEVFTGLVSICLLLLNFPAQADTFSANRVEINRADLDTRNPIEVISSISTFKAGDNIPAHFHNGIETAYIIQGATLIDDSGAIVTMKTGETLFNLQKQIHGGITIAPKNELKLFTVHIVDKYKPLYNFASDF